jgi:hypothetical protein
VVETTTVREETVQAESATAKERKFQPKVGSTISFKDHWQKLTSDSFILRAITGYEIEFDQDPPTSRFMGGTMAFSTDKLEAIDKEVDSLLKKKAISQCMRSEGDFVSQIFAIPKKGSDKLRVILNLKELNKFITYKHFKMENLDCVVDLILKNDFFVSIDLKDAYFSIPIAKNHRKFLRFIWRNKLYQYNVLCFGLASAPRVFTKCMKPLIAHLREKGFRVSIYIDDLILMHQDPKILRVQSDFTLSALQSLGFSINVEKSHLCPVQNIKHLGFLLNSLNLSIALPNDKKQFLRLQSCKILAAQHNTIRTIARLLGCYNALAQGSKWAKLFIRALERDKIWALRNSKGNFDKPMFLSDKARKDISWWTGSDVEIPRPMFVPFPSMTICSDASGSGWGAHNSCDKVGGRWSVVEQSNHINYLELKACFMGLQCLAQKQTDTTIHVRLDNTVALSYIVKQGGVIKKIDQLANALWIWCKERNIWLSCSYIPGMDNMIADEKSRIFHDNTEWTLQEWAFKKICTDMGRPDVDLFASRLNSKVKQYCSFERDPFSRHVDAFSVDWSQFKLCYAFPPFNMVGRVIQKMIQDKVEDLLLVCPKWPGQIWYSMLEQFKSDHHFIQFGNSEDLLYLPYDLSKTHGLWRKLHLCCFRLSYRQ